MIVHYLSYLIGIILSAYYVIIPPADIEPIDKSCPALEMSMAIHGLPPEQFSYIMWRESRCKADAINPNDPHEGSFGLLQINSIHLKDKQLRPKLWAGSDSCQVETTGDLLIAWKNMCLAGILYGHAGLDPWKV